MTTTDTDRNVDRELTIEQLVRRIRSIARTRLGMSAEDMVAAYKNGTLDDPCAVMDALGDAFLLPEDHPLHAPLDKPLGA